MGKDRHKYYSQNGEDYLLWKLFDDKKAGFYVDVGAFDGIHLSNSFSFEKEGWTGVCIEANTDYFGLCRKNRPGTVCIHAVCVADGHKDLSDFYVDKLGLFSNVAGHEENVLDNHYKGLGLNFDGFHKISVPARTLNRILDENVPSGVEIDFLSVDVEGAEIDVLKGLDFQKYRPRIVILEANSTNVNDQIISYMVNSLGYFYARNVSVNAFFARDEADVEKLKSIDVNCSIEPQIHPLGKEYTIRQFIQGKAVSGMKIAVYITSYNQKEYLVEAIESVLSQTLRPHQIIIVDDCSTDGSKDIIANYAKRYPGLITPIYHEKNLGVVRSRIHALNSVRGNYVTYLDGDDRFLPIKLEKEAALLSANPEVKIVFSNYYYISSEGQRTGLWAENETPPEGDVFRQVFAREFPRRNLFRNELVNYEACKAIGFHDPGLTIYEDYEMRIRMTKHLKTAYCNEPLIEYRLHNNGLSRLGMAQHLASLDYIYHKNKILLDDLTATERHEIKHKFTEWLGNISNRADREIRDEYEKAGSKENFYAKKLKADTDRGGGIERGSNLIFVISQPRAGSTLVQRILGGHPDVHTIAEPWIMLHPLYALKRSGITAEYDASHARDGLDDFLTQVPEGEELYIEALRRMGSFLYKRIIEHSGTYLFLDKTPRYYLIIPELYRVFPEAKFVFILRNPVAVFASLYNAWFKGRLNDLIEAPHYKDLQKGPGCIVDGIKLLKEKAIVVQYEDLVLHPERTVKHTCSRLGIPFHEYMLEYGARSAPKGRFGDAIGIRKYKRPVRDSLNKWINELSDPEIYKFISEYIKGIGPDILSKMGYPEDELRNKIDYFALNRRGEEQFAKGDEEGAFVSFMKAIEMSPDIATAYNNMGVLCWQRGENKNAFKYFVNALRADPDDRATVLNCGRLMTHFKQFEEAKNLYMSYVSRHQDDEEMYALLEDLLNDREAV
jgi:FkbM family methyltransferase